MNVFYLPSWYPDPARRLIGGVFLQEMVTALARHHPDLNLYVGLWGQGHLELSSARLRAWLAHPGLGLPARAPRRQAAANLVELYRPAWTWRYGVRRGNIEAILRAARELFAAARAECGRIDLIHAQVSFPAGYLAMRLAEETGVPMLVTEHMGPFPFRHYLRAGAIVPDVAEPLRRARRVTAVSRALATELRARVGVEAVVVPNGVDETFFSPARSGARDGFGFLTVANLEPGKGIEDLLHAIAALRPPRTVRFRIAGRGSRGGACRGLARRLGVDGQVEWLGLLDRAGVRDAMRASDAFVLPSRHESFGVVFVEALACGKPVVGTRCGGPEDIVNDGNGELVPVADVPAIAAALERMIAGAGRYDPAAIRADFESRFSSATVSRRFAELYRATAGAD